MERIFVAILIGLFVPYGLAQTPAQMEYERQQREARAQQERQQQEQQRLQQIQQENARRQQEEMNRLNKPAPTPTPGQAPSYSTPGYQAPSQPASPSGPQQPRADAPIAPTASKWVKIGIMGIDDYLYADQSSRVKSRDSAIVWALFDHEKPQNHRGMVGARSVKQKMEYNCTSKQGRSLGHIAFSDRMGNGNLVDSLGPEATRKDISPGTARYTLLNFACGTSKP